MNLPDSAITFVDAFRGVLSPQNAGGRDLSGIYGSSDLPMVHCHCFTREIELDKAEQDIRQVSLSRQCSVTWDTQQNAPE